MSSIESLKKEARNHEQKEQWVKALTLYQQAIDKLEEEEQPDIGLYNRVGDIHTRTGNNDAAVSSYESAVDLYLEADLPNNAIAVCKKILRNLPDRHQAFLRMGQIRADQGFLVDARQNFLTYAERVQADGDLDEALRALVEFADLAPEDTDIRLAIAQQFESHERTEEALEQLATGYAILTAAGKSGEAAAFEAKIRELDPENAEAHLSGTPPAAAAAAQEDGDAFGSFGTVDIDSGAEDEAEAAVEMGDFADISVGADEDAADDAVAVPDDTVEGDFDFGGLGDDAADADEESVEVGADAGMADADALAGADDLGGFELSGDDSEDEPEAAADPEKEAAAAELEALADSFGAFGSSDDVDDDEAPEGGELPLMGIDDDDDLDDDAPEGGDLPLMGFDDDDGAAEPEDAEPVAAEFDLGALDTGDDAEAEETPVEVAFEESRDEPEPAPPATPREQYDALVAEAEESPDDVGLRQRMLEVAFQVGADDVLAEAHLGLARALSAGGNRAKAQAMFQQVLSYDVDNAEARAALDEGGTQTRPVSEVAASEDYVDLGSMILGDDDEEKTTRFTVAYEEPSGDEAADFAKMLSQFKEKVSENFDASDVRAHHDLGTAYKEMGLLDESIEEFQAALRASVDHLPTYELLGQVFMEKGQFDAAARVLSRALETDWEIEDELLGIYYYLGRAKEELGDNEAAVEYYDRVFSLDINFADVTERLRDLR